MADVTYIDFYNTLELATYSRLSPRTKITDTRGIQLLPNSANPYVQETKSLTGFELEDWEAHIISMWDNSEYDITSNFVVEDTTVDNNANTQIIWSLTNVPYDLGSKMCYIRLTQINSETYYSTPFQISSNDSERTVRVDYRQYDSDVMKSIQLKMYYWQPIKQQEVSVYYEQSTKLTRTNTIKSQKAEKWITQNISNDLWIKISDMMESRDIYFDFTRCNLFEAVDVKELESDNNSTVNTLKLSFDSSDIYDPLYVPPIPPIETTLYFNYNLNSYLHG